MKKLFIIVMAAVALITHSINATPTIIAGKVTSSTTGLPINGATVQAARGNQIVYTTTTNASGMYSMSVSEHYSYTLTFSAPGYQTQSVGVRPREHQTTTVNIALTPNGGTITGTVRNANTSNPISGATVQIFQNGIFITSVTTNGSGVYSTPNLAPGSYTVTASAATFETQSIGTMVQIGMASTVNFNLATTPGTIAGIITDSSSLLPIADGLVSIYDGANLIGTATTDVYGMYSISGLTPGFYSVVANADGYQSNSVGANVTANTTTTVNIKLNPSAGILNGTVTDASTGNTIEGAAITVYLGTTLIESTLTDMNGNYSFDDLAPGSYTVIASAANYSTATTGALITANMTTTANISLSPNPGTIAGTVINSMTQNPIAGATIEIFSNQTLIATVFSDNSGNYEAPNISPGSYTVIATQTNYQSQFTGAIVTSNTTSQTNFALVPFPGRIAGVVKDANSLSPIPGARISIISGQTTIITVISDSSGNYIAPNLPPGNYVVYATANNYQSSAQGAQVTANVTTPVNFSLHQNPGTIAGNVFNTVTGIGIAGASVSISLGNTIIATATTDANGSYSVPNIAPGNYIVDANAPNFGTSIVNATVTPNNTATANLGLAPNPGSIVGTVTDDTTGYPISAAMIKVINNGVIIATTLTDSSGNYQVLNLIPGTYDVNATHDTYQISTIGAIVTSNTSTRVNFALLPNPGALTGMVIDATTSNPIVGAIVSVAGIRSNANQAMTDATGTYTISNLAPGSSIAIAGAETYQTSAQAAYIHPNLISNLNFSLLQHPGTIEGTVTNAVTGAPIAGASITVLQDDININATTTDTNGHYIVTGLQPGAYVIIVNAKNFAIASSGATAIANTTSTVDFELSPNIGALQGTVIDATTKAPLESATVEIFQGPILVTSTTTDPNGNYQVTNLPPGIYTVLVTLNSYQTQTMNVAITQNNTSTANFQLASNPGTVMGTVSDAMTGYPIASASVSIFSGSTYIASVLTDSNGFYTLPNLAPGTYSVVASATDYQTQSSTVVITAGGTSTLNFSLSSSPGTISGTLLDNCSQDPVDDALVVVMNGSSILAFTLSDPNGNFSIPDLPAGNLQVTISKNNTVTYTTTVTVNLNATTTLNVSLTPIPLPPTSISSSFIRNKYLTQIDYVPAISWTPSPSGCITNYAVFRNSTKIALLPASTLKYIDNTYVNQTGTYSVIAINSFGQSSQPLSTTVSYRN